MTVEFDQPISTRVTAADHRALMSLFPTGVAIITAIDDDGEPHGMTCTSLSSVTLSPPTLLICLNQESGTLRAVRGGRFAVNLLHARGRKAAEVFSTGVENRFSVVRWRRSEVTGMPWLAEDAHAFAGCVVRESTVVGDHEVVLGEVCEIVQARDLPLLYGMREFSVWTPKG